MVQTALAIFAVKYEAALSQRRPPPPEYLIAACVFYIKVWCSRWGHLSLSLFLPSFPFFLHSREAADKSSRVRKFV